MKLLLLLLLSTSIFAVDHSLFDQVLMNYTIEKDGQVLVNYSALKKNSGQLEIYLASLSKVEKDEYEKWSKNDQLAFLINLYNAQTIILVMKHYPVKSIKKIGGFFSSPWKKKFFTLFGKKIHLNRLEHKIIRPMFKEPRVHFALNCASIGCPSLARTAFTGKKLERQLDAVTLFFLKNKKKNYFKMERLYLSKIFDWYEEDFGNINNFVAKFIPEWKGDFDMDFLKYNWNLNQVEESHE